MNRIVAFSFGLVSLLVACSESETGKASYADELIGLGSPIRLEADSSVVYLRDYFPEPLGIRISSVDKGLSFALDTIDYELLIKGQPERAVSLLKLELNQQEYVLPVFSAEKHKVHFRYQPTDPEVKEVALAGSFNGWNPAVSVLENNGESYHIELLLNPGHYQYKVVEDGEWKLDSTNPQTADNGMGKLNSVLTVGDPDAPKPLCSAVLNDSGELRFKAESGISGLCALIEDRELELKEESEGVFIPRIPSWAGNLERAHIRVYSWSDLGRCNDLLIPLNKGLPVLNATELNRFDRNANIMYFAMVDRFKDGDANNNHPTQDPEILPKANHFGGDLKGITQASQSGYFTELGINALWISPITQNPEGAYGLWDKGVRSKFSAYHGYWPVSSTQVDYRFGDDESLREMIDELHQQGINIYLDYVANHVHEEHPVFRNHPDWATDLYLPDGSLNTERWDEHRLTTWFDVFLPTLDLSRPEVVEPMTDSALYWLQSFDLDGFRHDATKHIPELFWRTLTRKIKQNVVGETGRQVFQIGETYGSPELISMYVGSGMLDAQFDFNLYDAMVDAFAKESSSFDQLVKVLNESLHQYGHHHTMGNITGNQDRTRFISYADGSVLFDEDPKLAGWTRSIENQGEIGYQRLRMLTAFLMCVPGIPCIYYGDEIGIPGANDPDNRRMMRFKDWSEEEQLTFEHSREWIGLRRSSMALNYGTTRLIQPEPQVLLIERSYPGETVYCAFNKSVEDKQVEMAGKTITVPAMQALVIRP